MTTYNGAGEIVMKSNLAGAVTSINTDNSVGIFIGSKNGSIGQAVLNSAMVGGTTNTINTGLSNVVMLGCDTITATESDMVYLPNITMPDGGMIKNASGDSVILAVAELTMTHGTLANMITPQFSVGDIQQTIDGGAYNTAVIMCDEGIAYDKSNAVYMPSVRIVGTPNTLNPTQGYLLLGKMTEAVRDAMTPEAAMVIFNLDNSKAQVYDGATWQNCW